MAILNICESENVNMIVPFRESKEHQRKQKHMKSRKWKKKNERIFVIYSKKAENNWTEPTHPSTSEGWKELAYL